ncbi:RNA-directed DNA polymerase [Alcaligenaceae bacterium]|nr:RNA-directed DNA polymerase [Alcaligenaceae bacterium]
MVENKSDSWVFRALVTETLPYEVPVIFSNDKFYRLSSKIIDDPDLAGAIGKLHRKLGRYTIPYQYRIKKDSARTTELSIAHPLWQQEVCRFYAQHEGSLLSYCGKSKFSLRHPIALAALYVEGKNLREKMTSKTGVVESISSDTELNPAHFVSYFTYGRFNLLGRFYSSKEFLRLEKRFRFVRTLDISKCFYHIYTHSIAWQVKDKDFAKNNTEAYSFENSFDKLMQMANYNETNGIVVGPEISRIFAEIILQGVDLNIQRQLERQGLVEGRDYSIRRYVDDFSIFANSEEVLGEIQSVVVARLADVKLYLNDKKIGTYERPFITPLTLARSELGECLQELEGVLAKDGSFEKNELRRLKVLLGSIRSIVARHNIELGSVSGWVMSSLRRLLDRGHYSYLYDGALSNADKWLRFVQALLEVVFHVCSLDLRVRTTYNMCQIIYSAQKVKGRIPGGHFEQLQHIIENELVSLVSQYDFDGVVGDPVEILNVIIAGAHFIGADFVSNSVVSKALLKLSEKPLTYFVYISLNFCYLTDVDRFCAQIDNLNERVRFMLSDAADVFKYSERYLILCDYLSSPAVSNKDKRAVFDMLFGGTISKSTMDSLGRYVGFVDWDGFQVNHTLRRKELRPVYAVS